jgi:hypothetical protein
MSSPLLAESGLQALQDTLTPATDAITYGLFLLEAGTVLATSSDVDGTALVKLSATSLFFLGRRYPGGNFRPAGAAGDVEPELDAIVVPTGREGSEDC